MSGSKWPRDYERVPSVHEVDPNDFVAFTKARHQWVRDRQVSTSKVVQCLEGLLYLLLTAHHLVGRRWDGISAHPSHLLPRASFFLREAAM